MKPQISTPEELLTAICIELGCDINKIKSKVRKRELVNVRHIYSYIGKVYFDFTLMSLSKEIGGRDHTTIIHSINTLKDLVKSNNPLMTEMLAIVLESLGLTESDKKNYEQFYRQHNSLVNEHDSLKLKYGNCCAENLFLQKKIANLETQNRLYKSNALLV